MATIVPTAEPLQDSFIEVYSKGRRSLTELSGALSGISFDRPPQPPFTADSPRESL
jgi:hypothetical protein